MVHVVPQFEINQQLEVAPAGAVAPLHALLVGPDYAVRSYALSKTLVAIGAYTGVDLAVGWPGRQAGEVVDQKSVALNIDRACLRFVNEPADATMVVGKTNQIRTAALNLVDKTSFPRSVSILADVKIGDHCRLTKAGDVLVTSVTKLIPEVVAAVVASPVAAGTNEPTGGGYTAPTAAAAGTYTGLTNTVYIVRVTRAGDIALGEPTPGQVTFSTSTNVDAGGPLNVTSAVAIPLGSLGVTLTLTGDELKLGDEWTITVTAAAEGAVKTIELANQLPTAMQTGNLDLEVSILADILVPVNRIGYAPLKNVEMSATQVTVKSGVLARHERTDTNDLPVILGTAHISYRALRTVGANAIIDIADSADVLALLGGVDVPESVLTYAAHRALANAGGVVVRCLAVESDDLAGYQKALSKIKEREDIYRLVPLTHDEAIISALNAVVHQRSGATVGRWATSCVALELKDNVKLHEGLATIIDDGSASGTQYTIVHHTGGQFITKGTRPGDVVRCLYTTDGFGGDSYTGLVVDAVLSEEEVRVLVGSSILVSIPSKFELWRPLTAAERVADWGLRTRALASRRVTSVFPGKPGRAGVKVPSYFLAASLAALRCAAAPQQGLTNAEVLGWDDLSESTETYGDLLDEAANYGGYIVTQSPAGLVYIRKQLTTDLVDVKHAEDSITVNLDSISFFFKSLLAPFVGRSNNVQSNLDLMAAAINAGIVELISANFSRSLGGQIVGAKLVSLRPHAVLLDRVVARIELIMPYAINNGTLDLVI